MSTQSLNQSCVLCHQTCSNDRFRIERYCDCYWHQSCLTRFIEIRQQTHCPECRESFQKSGHCRIIRKRRPFMDFFCTPGAFALLTIFMLIFFYGLQILLIIVTSYLMAATMIENTIIEIFIILPGIIYDFYYIFCIIITISLMITLFRSWRDENPIVVVEWISPNTKAISSSSTQLPTAADVLFSSSNNNKNNNGTKTIIPIVVTGMNDGHQNTNPNRLTMNQSSLPLNTVIVNITSP